MDLIRSSSYLWSLYIFITLALVLGVSSNAPSSRHSSTFRQNIKLDVASSDIPPAEPNEIPSLPNDDPSDKPPAKSNKKPSLPNDDLSDNPSDKPPAKSNKKPSLPNAAPSDKPPAKANKKPSLPNDAPLDESPGEANEKPSLPNAAPSDKPPVEVNQGPSLPNAAPSDKPPIEANQIPSLPNVAPTNEGPPPSNAVRKTQTPPPPPDQFTKGEPRKMSEFFEQTFGDQRLQFFDNGTTKLSIDPSSGSGFKSKNEYLFITMSVQMKLIPGNSAGSVTTFYLTSSGFGHDEIDIEFLGNATGEPYTLHTNVYVDGTGNREQQFHLWFDPTLDFHTYTLSWTSKRIAWYVDGIPIRQYKSDKPNGVPYPSRKGQRIIASLWNADDWATQGGRVKADWSHGPLVAYYKDFTSNFCIMQGESSSCGILTPSPTDPNVGWLTEELGPDSLVKLKWSQDNLMIYDYCKDTNRFPQGMPKECKINI